MRRGVTQIEAILSAGGAFAMVAAIATLAGSILPKDSAKPQGELAPIAIEKAIAESPSRPKVIVTPESLAAAFDSDLAAAVEDYMPREIEIRGTLSRVEEGAVEYATDGKIIRVELTRSLPFGTENREAGHSARVVARLREVKEDCIVLEHGLLLQGMRDELQP